MQATRDLRDRGQSLWLDNITRGLLDAGTIQRYIDDDHVTGLTSNPSIFDAAITTGDYDGAIVDLARRGLSSDEILFELTLADLQRAADLFRPVHDDTDGVDGWVSLEVSPLLAFDAAATIAAAQEIHRRADRTNLFVKIPGTPPGLEAIEECVAAGVAVNVTLLFDAAQYLAAAEAYLRGVERRIAAGLNPAVASVASLFVSRWDTAVADRVSPDLANQLGLAVGRETYLAYRAFIASDRFLRAANRGARVQRLLWASTKTKDPGASPTLYVRGLVAPLTINTVPDATLRALKELDALGAPPPRDDEGLSEVFERFAAAGVDRRALAATLQQQGAASFASSWRELLSHIENLRSTSEDAP
ncbi:MAG: transaldolase [Acidobacteria bacterium]|nr:transaldolase [Acidobacteriota bacterium]